MTTRNSLSPHVTSWPTVYRTVFGSSGTPPSSFRRPMLSESSCPGVKSTFAVRVLMQLIRMLFMPEKKRSKSDSGVRSPSCHLDPMLLYACVVAILYDGL